MSGRNQYSSLRGNFLTVCKRVLKEDLTSNPDKHREYLTDLTQTYNAIVRYIASVFDRLDDQSKKTIDTDWIYVIGKVGDVFRRLKVTLPIPVDYNSLLTVETIIENYNGNNSPLTNTESNDAETSSGTSHETVRTEIPRTATQSTQTSKFVRDVSPVLSDSEILFGFEEIFNTAHNMAATAPEKIEYIRAAAQMVSRSYSGDPLALASFVSSIRLLKSVTDDKFKEVFIEFVRTKLEGKALECIPPDPASIDEIIEALKRNIKPDNSKVVSGRLLALRPDKSKLTEFTEQAEKLAEALQRALTLEGITQETALEMTVERTIEVCRNAARTDLLKSVLASNHFRTPKEVIAKYIVESATQEKEKQVLAFHSYKRQNRKNFDNSNNGKQKNGYRGRGNRNGGNGRNSNNGRNYSNNNGNNSRNDNGNQSGNRNYNGNNNRNNNRGNWNNSWNNGGYRGSGDNRNVRYAENYDGPQIQLGATHNQN